MGAPKSAEWKAKIRALNVAKRGARATPEQQSAFHAVFGTRIDNWDEIGIQNNRKHSQHAGWPRLRSVLRFACTRCGRPTSKVMTSKLLGFPEKTSCRSCASGAGVPKTVEHMVTPRARARAMRSFAKAKRGLGTPENTAVRREVEEVLGTSVTNWEELTFTRYGNPAKRSRLSFVCRGCQQPSRMTFTSLDELPHRCQKCIINDSFSGMSRSAAEKEIEAYLRTLGETNILAGQRTIIPPLELDLYLPERCLAIEYNGLYWHANRSRFYHVNKLRACAKQGIRLLQVFEDEWRLKRDIVRKQLARILGRASVALIKSGHCDIRRIDAAGAAGFLARTHIQGPDSSCERFGAYHRGDLVAVMTFKPGRGEEKHGPGWWILSRFAALGDMDWIASRLLTAFRHGHPSGAVVAYADMRWSIGNVYRKMGFALIDTKAPGAWAVVGGRRRPWSALDGDRVGGRADDGAMVEEKAGKKRKVGRLYDCGFYVFRQEAGRHREQ